MNAGQDHGWCFGYTCLKRLMAFNAIVSTGKEYHIYFGATNPSKIRLHLLNAKTTETVVLHFMYTNPQRLAVRNIFSFFFFFTFFFFFFYFFFLF